MNSLVDVFIGPVQSKYAAVIIVSAVIIVCISLIFSNGNIPLGQKMLSAFLLFLICIPSILFTLFELTCIVTGSTDKTPWCGIYAWIIVILVMIYSIIIVVFTIMSVNASKNMAITEKFYNNKKMYEKFASEMVAQEEEEVPAEEVPVEGFNTLSHMQQFLPKSPFNPLMSAITAEKMTSNGPAHSPEPSDASNYIQATTDVVLPTIEQFTSCGAVVPQTGRQ